MKKKFLLALFLLLITIPLAGCKKEEVEVTSNFDQGVSLVEEKKYTEALESFQKAAEETPDAPQIYLEIADIYEEKGLDSEAQETLDIGIENAQDDKDLYYKKAEIFFNNKDYTQALENYETSEKKGLEGDEIIIKQGICNIKLEDFENAKTKLKKIEKNSDYFADANYYLSILETSDYSNALSLIENVKNPQNESLIDFSATYKTLLEEIIENNSKEEVNENYVKLLHGYSLIKVEQFELAKTIILPVAEHYESEEKPSYQANFYLGTIYYHLGEYENAKSELMTSIVANPTDPITLHLLGLTYEKLNDQVNSIESFEKSIILDPNNENSRYDFIQALIYFKINSKAESNYEDLIKLETDKKPQYQLELAQFLNDYQNNATGANTITSYLINEWSDFENADAETKSEIYDTHGWSLFLLGNNEESQTILVKAIEENEFSASAFYHLAKVMEQIEDYEKAVEYYARAIDLSFEEGLSVKANQEYQKLTQ